MMEGNTDFESIYQAFEKASVEFQNPIFQKDAEKILTEFRRLPNAVLISRRLLERGDKAPTQFQAVIMLRDCMLKTWPSISAEEKESTRNFLLNFLLTKDVTYFVKNEVLNCVASLCKRAWTEGEPEHQRILRSSIMSQMISILERSPQIGEILSNPNQTEGLMQFQTKRIAILFLAALVDEFSSKSKSSYGLSWEFHRKTLVSFQQMN